MQEERAVTAGDYARSVKRHLVPVLLIAALAALAAALITAFVYNRAREEYFLTFVVEFSDEESASEVRFRYETLVFADNLAAAKATDASFAGIDVDRMSTEQEIAVSRTGGEDAFPSYTVVAAGKYFADREQATRFLRAVVEQSVAALPRVLPEPPLIFLPRLPFGNAVCMLQTADRGAVRVRYRQNSVSVEENGINPVFSAAAAFFVFFFAASSVFLAVDRRRSAARTEEESAGN